MIREAQFDAQCSACGGRITAGEQMDYLPRSGEFPARTSHPGECPAPKPKKVRGVNHAQRQDPEEVFLERECGRCRLTTWCVKRTSLASRREKFLGHCCDGRYGDEPLYGERHLKAVA